jgi:hypothetical protein
MTEHGGREARAPRPISQDSSITGGEPGALPGNDREESAASAGRRRGAHDDQEDAIPKAAGPSQGSGQASDRQHPGWQKRESRKEPATAGVGADRGGAMPSAPGEPPASTNPPERSQGEAPMSQHPSRRWYKTSESTASPRPRPQQPQQQGSHTPPPQPPPQQAAPSGSTAPPAQGPAGQSARSGEAQKSGGTAKSGGAPQQEKSKSGKGKKGDPNTKNVKEE